MAARPFGVRTQNGTVPAAPPRITVEPMHAVRQNGSAYEDHHILAGDGPLQAVGKGSSGPATIPAVPPPTRHELAVDAGMEAGMAAGTAAGEDVGMAIAKNKTIPKSEVEAAAYKAGFEAGQQAGTGVVAASLVAKKVNQVMASKPKPTLLGKSKKMSADQSKKMSVVKKAGGTIKHHPAHPASKIAAPAAHDGKAKETAQRLEARKTDKAADGKVDEEEKKKEEESKKNA